MNLVKKILYLGLFLIVFSLIWFNLMRSRNQRLPTKTNDFNFIFNYGVGAKNQLDTIKGQYTKDMVIEPSITTKLKLSEEEMNTIYLDMQKINILSYPENFKPMSNSQRTPFDTYSVKIIVNGEEKNIFWKDENISQSKEALQLRKLFKKIQEMITNKEEFKKLPQSKGGYD